MIVGRVPVNEAAEGLAALEREFVSCRFSPRLVEWREQTARVKRAGLRLLPGRRPHPEVRGRGLSLTA